MVGAHVTFFDPEGIGQAGGLIGVERKDVPVTHVGHGFEQVIDGALGQGEDRIRLEPLGINLVGFVGDGTADLQDHGLVRLLQRDGNGGYGRSESIGAEIAGVVGDKIDRADTEDLAEEGLYIGISSACHEGATEGSICRP